MEENLLFTRIKALADLSGKSINQVAKDLGYPRNSLNNYKRNKIPSAVRLFELARYFEVAPEYLLGEIDDCSVKAVEQIFHRLTTEQKQEMYNLCQDWLFERIELLEENRDQQSVILKRD